MTATLPLFDVVAQLRRRWVIVAAGVLVGLVVGVAAGSPSPSGLQLGLGAAVGAVVGIVAGLVVVHLQPRVTTVADVRRSLELNVHPGLAAEALFHRLADAGRVVLVSSHVMDEAERCDRLLLMREGRIIANGTPSEIRGDARDIEDAFLRIVEGEAVS